MTLGIPEFDMVTEAARHLMESELKRESLLDDLKNADAEVKFWRTELFLRSQHLSSAMSEENSTSPKNTA